MRKYDIIHEVEHPEQIIKQYHYTTALDTFIITITKEEQARQKTVYNTYTSRLNYGNIHFVVGIMEEDIELLKDEAIDYIQQLEKEIAEGSTDC